MYFSQGIFFSWTITLWTITNADIFGDLTSSEVFKEHIYHKIRFVFSFLPKLIYHLKALLCEVEQKYLSIVFNLRESVLPGYN